MGLIQCDLIQYDVVFDKAGASSIELKLTFTSKFQFKQIYFFSQQVKV